MIYGFEPIKEEWKALDTIIGSQASISSLGEELRGEVLDMDDEGLLILRKEDGYVDRVISGDVSLRSHDA